MPDNTAPFVTAMSTKATVKVTSYDNRVITGWVYNAHFDKAVPFSDGLELLTAMENLFDALSFPGRFEDYRHFARREPKKSRKGIKERETMSDKTKDEQATFIIHVQFRRNATWQGTVTWTDGRRTEPFRSALELNRLIDSTLLEQEEEGDAPGREN